MFADKLDADRFFARLKAFDLACPRCGHVYIVGKSHKTFKPRLGRWECSQCGLTLMLGILAWPVRERDTLRQPADQIPDYREMLAIRKLSGGFLKIDKYENKVGSQVNLTLREGCRCEVSTSPYSSVKRTIVHPKCPLHSDSCRKDNEKWEMEFNKRDYKVGDNEGD
jgi:ribosomal protein S27AE